MSKEQTLRKNVTFMAIGNFASKILTFLLIPLYSSVLTTAEYGTADIISTTITLLTPILTLQINEAVIRFCLDPDADRDAVISNGTFLLLGGTLLLALLSPIFFLIDAIQPYYTLFFLQYATSAFYALFSQYAKGIDQVRDYAIAGFLSTIIVVGANLTFLLWLRLGVKGYILSFVLGHTVSTLYLVVRTKAWQHIRPRAVNRSVLKPMLSYSAPMIPNSISWWITNSSDKYMITFIVGVAANGVYSMAYKIPSLLSTVNSIFMSAWHISAVEEFGSEESKTFFEKTYYKMSGLTALLVSGLICMARVVARFLYANDFYVAWKYSIVLLIGFMFSSLSSFLGSVYTASKKTTPLLYTSLVGSGFNILFNALLIPLIGILGAALATTASYLLVWAIRLFHAKKILRFRTCGWKNVVIGIVMTIQFVGMYWEIPGNFFISLGGFVFAALLFRDFIFELLKTVQNQCMRAKKA